MAVIELGDLSHEPVAAEGTPRLRAVLALLAAALLLTLGGSAVPRSHALTPLWQAPFEEGGALLRVTGTSVYVLGLGQHGRFTAYDLRTGATRWRVPVGTDGGWFSARDNGVVLLSGTGTVAFDDERGARLWSRPGQLLAGTAGRAVLVDWDDTADTAGGARLVSLPDGAVLWSERPGQRWADVAADPLAPDRLVTVGAGGLVTVRELTGGRLVASARQPWPPPGRITVEQHGIYVAAAGPGGLTLQAYDTETLRRRWSLPVGDYPAVSGCGPVLCVVTPDGVSGLDRATGVVRWSHPGAANPALLTPGRLVVDEGADGLRHALIDAADGRTVAELGGAAPIPGDGDHPYVLDRQTIVAQLDPGTGSRQPRGLVEGTSAYGCQVAGHTLVCNVADNRLVAVELGPVG